MQEEYTEIDPPLTSREQVTAALLKRWLKAGWESNDNGLVDEHFHPNCIVSGLAPEVVEGIEELRVVHRTICARMQHRRAEFLSLMIRGDHFAAAMEFEGCHQESGTDVAFEVACYGVMKDGLVYRAHNVIDYTGLYAKLGLLDTVALAKHFG